MKYEKRKHVSCCLYILVGLISILISRSTWGVHEQKSNICGVAKYVDSLQNKSPFLLYFEELIRQRSNHNEIDCKYLFDLAVKSKNIELIQQSLTPEIKDYLESDRGSLNLLNIINNGGDVLEVLKVLIDNGANINVSRSENGQIISTPLLSAIKSSMLHNPVEVIKLLTDNGADIKVKDYNGWMPLSAAINRINFVHSFEGEDLPDEVELRLDREEYIKYRNEHYAQQFNEELERLADESLKIVELLLKARTSKKVQDHSIEEFISLLKIERTISLLKQSRNKIEVEYGKKLDSLLQKYQYKNIYKYRNKRAFLKNLTKKNLLIAVTRNRFSCFHF